MTEDSPLDEQPQKRNYYARAKIAAERLLASAAQEKGLELVIARPGIVVGSKGAPQHSGVGLWTKDTQLFLWGSGRRPLPFVLVTDVADALVRMAESPVAAGRSYNLVGDVLLTAREWVTALRTTLKRDFHFRPQSVPSWYAEELFKYLVKVAIRRPGAEPPSWRDFSSRTCARGFDNSRPKRELGWKPVGDRAMFLAAALPPHGPAAALPPSSG